MGQPAGPAVGRPCNTSIYDVFHVYYNLRFCLIILNLDFSLASEEIKVIIVCISSNQELMVATEADSPKCK